MRVKVRVRVANSTRNSISRGKKEMFFPFLLLSERKRGLGWRKREKCSLETVARKYDGAEKKLYSLTKTPKRTMELFIKFIVQGKNT